MRNVPLAASEILGLGPVLVCTALYSKCAVLVNIVWYIQATQ